VEHAGKEDVGEQLKVVYTGSDLPDTFREDAQAVAHGEVGPDGVFRAGGSAGFEAAGFEVDAHAGLRRGAVY
jgi:hypothetical protein